MTLGARPFSLALLTSRVYQQGFRQGYSYGSNPQTVGYRGAMRAIDRNASRGNSQTDKSRIRKIVTTVLTVLVLITKQGN